MEETLAQFLEKLSNPTQAQIANSMNPSSSGKNAVLGGAIMHICHPPALCGWHPPPQKHMLIVEVYMCTHVLDWQHFFFNIKI